MHDGKKIVVIGGGHGSSVVLSSLSNTGAQLGAVLSMADDGGSTGRLRKQYGVSPVGDIRQCLVALSKDPGLAELFSYRFREGELNGHSLGNLILSAGELQKGNLIRAIAAAKKMLGVDAEIAPSTEDNCNLRLRLGDGEVSGVYKIANTDFGDEKPDLYLEPRAKLSAMAARLIREADLIIIAPGNFYCSIIPALLVEGMDESINDAKAKVVYICNLLNRRFHTEDYKVGDYVYEINRLTGGLRIDEVIYNTSSINKECLREGERQVQLDEENGDNREYKLVGREVSDSEKVPVDGGDKIASVRSLARHDRTKLRKVIIDILGNV
jgi:uncharacterized cofD-like protein